MNTTSEKAIECFKNGYNCSQSVFCSLSNFTGLDEDTSLKIATAFGAGIGRNQKVCGAVTGAIMAIGMKHGMGLEGNKEAKEHACDLTNEFIAEFKRKHQEIGCLELIGADMHTDEGNEKIEKENLFETRCARFVIDAAEIAEGLM